MTFDLSSVFAAYGDCQTQAVRLWSWHRMKKGSRWGIPIHQRAVYINDAGDVLSGSVYWSRLGNFHQQLVVALIFVMLTFRTIIGSLSVSRMP